MAHICNSISKYRMSCRNWLLAARQNLCSPVPFSTLFNTIFIKIPLNTIINYIIILTQFTSLQHCWGRWHCSQLPSGCSRSRPPRSCSTSHWFMLLYYDDENDGSWRLTKMMKTRGPDHVEQIFHGCLATPIAQLTPQLTNLENNLCLGNPWSLTASSLVHCRLE